jgi:hypothetical protein
MSSEYGPDNRDSVSNYPTNEAASDLRERATDIASRMKERATQAGSAVSESASRQRENAARGLDRVASTVHSKADSLPGGPQTERIVHRIADGMESTASYLRDHNFKDMGDNLIGVARKHPAESLIAALAIGFLVGRAGFRR